MFSADSITFEVDRDKRLASGRGIEEAQAPAAASSKFSN